MNLRHKRRALNDPSESGSFSDLAFLLIIYFIVIAGFNVNLGYLLNLPSKHSQRFVNTQDLVKLELGPSGDMTMNGAPVTVEAAEKEIAARVGRLPNLTVLLTIDSECPWQNVVNVIGAAQRARVENFSFRVGNDT